MTKKNNNPIDSNYIKDLKNKLLEDRYEIRRILNDYGCNDFLSMVIEIMNNMSDDLEDIGMEKESVEFYEMSLALKTLIEE